MASGFAVPVGVDGSGRSRIVRGRDQLKKIVVLHHLDGQSENPFQSIGIGQEIIFSDEDRARAIALDKIRGLFKRLQAERRAKLKNGYPKIRTEPGTGVMTAEEIFVDLETDTSNDPMSLSIGLGNSGAPRIESLG